LTPPPVNLLSLACLLCGDFRQFIFVLFIHFSFLWHVGLIDCCELVQAISAIEDAVDADPDNLQLLTDLTQLHQEHVKAVNAAANAKMASVATSAMSLARGGGVDGSGEEASEISQPTKRRIFSRGAQREKDRTF
jgi:hypothetical protein